MTLTDDPQNFAAPEVCDRREPVFFNTPFEPDLPFDALCDEMGHGRLEDQLDDQDFITRLIHRLAPREERVIRLRFGLGGIGEHTLEEIGEQLGCGRANVQRLEQKALRRLRWYARRTFTARAVQEGAHGPRSKHGQKATRKPEPEKHPARLKVAGSAATPVSSNARPNPSARKRPKSQQSEAGNHIKGGSRIWAASSPVEDRGFTQAQWLIKAFAWTSLSLFAALCLAAWSYTLGASGKTLFNEIFGHSDGPWVRFIVWLFAFSFGPISAMLAAYGFADWVDDRSRLSSE